MSDWRPLSLVLALFGWSCADLADLADLSDLADLAKESPVPVSSAAMAAQERLEVLAQLESEHRACRAMRDNIDTMPAVAGTPVLDEHRHGVLGGAKGWPVAFRRRPVRDRAKLQPYYRALAESLEDPRRTHETLETLLGKARYHREQVREILLPEGYFYAEDARLARWMVIRFDLQHFFDEKEIWLMRGATVYRLVRSEGAYRYADGPNEGDLASLLMFDRVMLTRESHFPALHIDFVPAAESYGFDRIRIERITPVGINAKVRYGPEGPWVDVVFADEESRGRIVCDIIGMKEQKRVELHRAFHRIHARSAERLRAAAADQVREKLMFDEPREEEGQQDGSLRPKWLWAYNHGANGYSFNEVWYPIFDQQGRPHPPQVCIDFVLDSYERASGTWFFGRDAPRGRSKGRVDFQPLDMPNRRSVEAVANYFREHPGKFDIWDLDPAERVRFVKNDEFFDYLLKDADRFRANNVVLIHGPRGDEAHYHSFIVSRTDPVTGMPIEVMENAGKPRFRSWSEAMRSGPFRSIKHVMIPKTEWLRDAYGEHPGTVASVDGLNPMDEVID